ncbi:hypothetical protein HK405_009554 [Cladochytrium tenue]|nr:hypothetical protein HK405_009554 [Cladochytrium tenue]
MGIATAPTSPAAPAGPPLLGHGRRRREPRCHGIQACLQVFALVSVLLAWPFVGRLLELGAGSFSDLLLRFPGDFKIPIDVRTTEILTVTVEWTTGLKTRSTFMIVNMTLDLNCNGRFSGVSLKTTDFALDSPKGRLHWDLQIPESAVPSDNSATLCFLRLQYDYAKQTVVSSQGALQRGAQASTYLVSTTFRVSRAPRPPVERAVLSPTKECKKREILRPAPAPSMTTGAAVDNAPLGLLFSDLDPRWRMAVRGWAVELMDTLGLGPRVNAAGLPCAAWPAEAGPIPVRLGESIFSAMLPLTGELDANVAVTPLLLPSWMGPLFGVCTSAVFAVIVVATRRWPNSFEFDAHEDIISGGLSAAA